MNVKSEDKDQTKKFLCTLFIITCLLGILMGVSYKQKNDVGCFATVQMLFPAAAIITIFNMKKGKQVPRIFYLTILITTGIEIIICILSVFVSTVQWNELSETVCIIGSVVCWAGFFVVKKPVCSNITNWLVPLLSLQMVVYGQYIFNTYK